MKLTLTTFLTIDGVMQAPGGPEEDRSDGFALGGWLIPFAEDMGQIPDHFPDADAFLFGRTTYQMMAAHWPQVTDPDDTVAQTLNSLPKYVASRTLDSVSWTNSTLLQGDVVAGVRALKAQPGRELQVHGSCGLAQTLMRHGLIDEYRLWVFPVVLGAGKRLFGAGTVPTTFERVDSTYTTGGVAVHTYRPAGTLALGNIIIQDGKEISVL